MTTSAFVLLLTLLLTRGIFTPKGIKIIIITQYVRSIVDLGSKIGLFLNTAKCESITDLVDDSLLRSFTRVQPCDATLLGAPLFQGKVLV